MMIITKEPGHRAPTILPAAGLRGNLLAAGAGQHGGRGRQQAAAPEALLSQHALQRRLLLRGGRHLGLGRDDLLGDDGLAGRQAQHALDGGLGGGRGG